MTQQIDREEIDWEKHQYLADGPDSTVFISPDGTLVVKRYHYPLAVVEAYAVLTNKADAFLQQNPCYGFLCSSTGIPILGIDYTINPVTALKIDQDANPVTYSKLIRGPKHLLDGSRQSSYWWPVISTNNLQSSQYILPTTILNFVLI